MDERERFIRAAGWRVHELLRFVFYLINKAEGADFTGGT